MNKHTTLQKQQLRRTLLTKEFVWNVSTNKASLGADTLLAEATAAAAATTQANNRILCMRVPHEAKACVLCMLDKGQESGSVELEHRICAVKTVSVSACSPSIFVVECWKLEVLFRTLHKQM